MTKDIRPFYEREHANLAVLVREFAEQYPQLASMLHIVDGTCEDPTVTRMVEGMAMLGARILQQLEDSYPKFTEALLNVNYPHYTQPFPSASIARFDYDHAARTITGVSTIPRGAIMSAIERGDVACKFRSAYAVTIAPLILARVAFSAVYDAPASVTPASGATSTIHIDIEGTCATLGLAQLDLPVLRAFIDGDASLRASLRDALFMRAVRAYVELDNDGRWIMLEHIPIAAAGFADDDALIPLSAASHPAYRLITEYFAFPEKFNFIDIDLAALSKFLPVHGKRLSLHLALSGIRVDSDIARILKPLSNKNLLLACTPVVNLFPQAAVPITVSHTKAEYPLLASGEHADAFDIHSVDWVKMVRDTGTSATVTQFQPYYSMRHGLSGVRRGRYWSIRRDDVLAQASPGHETQIALTDIDFNPLAPETATVSAQLNCTNRDSPTRLQLGQQAGELRIEGGPTTHPIRLLRKPTPSYRFAAGAHWRLIAQLSLNHRSLSEENLETFTEMLALYDLPQSPVTQRQIRGIAGMGQRSARAWAGDAWGGARVRGIEVCITLDEEAYVGSGMHAFVQVLDHFLALYVQMNAFTQLLIKSKATGQELIRCPPRNGDITLV
ncbi:MAG: type VI secretion system baseplate subunit TssF [Pseudomonadota bacterium]